MNKESAFNGVAVYLFNKHNIQRDNKSIQSHKDVNKFMVQYLESTDQPVGDVIENAECIQKDFKNFRTWSNKKLPK